MSSEAMQYEGDPYSYQENSPYQQGMPGLPNPMVGSQTISQDSNFMKWLFSFRKEVVSPLKYAWRGWEFDEEKMQWFLPIDKATGLPLNRPLMNRKGINWGISLIESYINPVFIVSNYDEQFMNYTMKQCMRNVIKNLYYRYKEFGLHKLDIDRVKMEIESKIQAILLGARGDGYRRFFAQQHHTQEIINNSMMQQQKPGILSGITSIFRKAQGQQQV